MLFTCKLNSRNPNEYQRCRSRPSKKQDCVGGLHQENSAGRLIRTNDFGAESSTAYHSLESSSGSSRRYLPLAEARSVSLLGLETALSEKLRSVLVIRLVPLDA